MAELMGLRSASFIDTNSTKVRDLMVNLVEYVQALDHILNPPTPAPVGTGAGPDVCPLIHLEKTPNGYPILPDPIPSEGWKKETWNLLFTDYIGQIYHLACGGVKKQVPYKLISEGQKHFIDPKYLPREMTFRPPRNIAFTEMKDFFDHLLQRQRQHGPGDTFKFQMIKLKGESVPALYKSDVDNDSDSDTRSNPMNSINNPNQPNPITSNSNNATLGPESRVDPDPRPEHGAGVRPVESEIRKDNCPCPGTGANSKCPPSNTTNITPTNDVNTLGPRPRPRPKPKPITKRTTRSQQVDPDSGHDPAS